MFLLGLTAYLCSMWHEEHRLAVASSWLPFVHLHWSSHLQQALPNGLLGGPLKPSHIISSHLSSVTTILTISWIEFGIICTVSNWKCPKFTPYTVPCK